MDVGKKSKLMVLCMICIVLCIMLSIFVIDSSPKKPDMPESSDAEEQIGTELQLENLRKLCKVWGYIKYTHPAFLQGKKDWDEELIRLIPDISANVDEEEVNHILYDWVVSLGELDYGTTGKVPLWALAEPESITIKSDNTWISDENYLGSSLSSYLSNIKEIPAVYRGKAPVNFDPMGRCIFQNEKTYEDMDYTDVRYRLLGLFRFWNAVEYYFPYLDIMDEDWDTVLLENLPSMLEADSKISYEKTIARVSTKLNDAHTMFANEKHRDYFFDDAFGPYSAPVALVEIEDNIVVKEVFNSADSKNICPLLPGDIILKLNGEDIDTVIEKRKQYISIPNDDKITKKIAPYLLRSSTERMKITVRRDSEDLTFTVWGHRGYYRTTYAKPYEILRNNIGLINPSRVPENGLPQIMDKLSDTDGLIIDLRQYPSCTGMRYWLAEYLIPKRVMPCLMTVPSKAVPGTFLYQETDYFGRTQYSSVTPYDKKVVLLMDEGTWSQPETVILTLRNGPNVTVMGENSIGANGDIVELPLPGGKTIMFSGCGVYTPNGEQTQRVGVKPDIYIERTLEGVKNEIDEYIEAAIEYIVNSQ